MSDQRTTSEPYLLGHSPKAIQRLVKMGRLLSPFTERLLVDAGITKGLRVLDVGCGPAPRRGRRVPGVRSLQSRRRQLSTLWQQMWTWVTRAFEYAGVETGMGMKLYGTFRDAGLPAPRLRYETSLGSGPDWDGYDVWAETIRPLTPVLERSGVATAEEIGLETLADRLRAETVATGGVARGPVLISAWTRIA